MSELERVEVVEQIKEFEFLMMGSDLEDWLQDRTREELELQRDFLKKKKRLIPEAGLTLGVKHRYCAGASIAALVRVVFPLVEAWRQRGCISRPP